MKFGDIATYYNGYAFKPAQYSCEGRRIIRIQDLTGNAYESHWFDGELPEKYHVKNGDVLISWSASLGVFVWHGEDAYLNQHIFKVVFNKANVLIPFFVHQARYVIGTAKHLAHGSTMTHLTKKVFDSLPFNLPSMDTQVHEAANLSFIEEQITKTKKQLGMFDKLVKSRFVEMFGDVESPKGRCQVLALKELIDLGFITYHLDGNHGGDYPRSSEFVSDGVPYIGANCIIDGNVTFDNSKYLTNERAKRIRKGKAVDGDVLFAHNASVGPVAILRTQQEMVILSTSLTAYRCDCANILPEYLCAYMKSPDFVAQYEKSMKQTTRNQVPITAQREFLFMVPDIERQEEFATFVQQVDKSEFIAQQQIDKLQMLYDSLAQEYFSAE